MKQRAKAPNKSRGLEPHLRPRLRPQRVPPAPAPAVRPAPPATPADTAWLRYTVLSSLLVGILFCLPVWTNSRPYPVAPVASWFPILPSPWDFALLAATLTSLIAAVRFYRPAVVFFLCSSFFLYLGDENRGQPAFYLYWVLLAMTLAPPKVAMAGCRIVVSSVYFWSGAQKLNATFFSVVPGWFVEPATNWGLPATIVQLLGWSVSAAPFVEIFIAFGLWWPRLRWTALALVGAVHFTALLFLGPLGHQHNLVVWPWNLAMVMLVWVLFGRERPSGWRIALGQIRSLRPASAAILLFCLLPALSYVGWWNSYFSFSLYSGNTATADLYVSKHFQDRLPPSLRRYVHPIKHPDLNWQLPFVFDHQAWAMRVLGVPPLPEPRAYFAMFDYLTAYAPGEIDCHMLVNPRAGPVLLCRRSGQTALAISK